MELEGYSWPTCNKHSVTSRSIWVWTCKAATVASVVNQTLPSMSLEVYSRHKNRTVLNCPATGRSSYYTTRSLVRVINVWNALPSTVNFTSFNVLGIALKRLISLVFSFVIFYLCDRKYVHSNCSITRFRAAVSVLVGPCCPALLKLYRCRCAYCCIIGQIKWWWWWWWRASASRLDWLLPN